MRSVLRMWLRVFVVFSTVRFRLFSKLGKEQHHCCTGCYICAPTYEWTNPQVGYAAFLLSLSNRRWDVLAMGIRFDHSFAVCGYLPSGTSSSLSVAWSIPHVRTGVPRGVCPCSFYSVLRIAVLSYRRHHVFCKKDR